MSRLLTGALTALALLVAAPPASAAITLTYSGTTIGIQGTGDNATFVGFDNNATPGDDSDDTVTVRNSTGVDNQSGGACVAVPTPPLGTYFHCPAAATALTATFGAGNDRLTFEAVCVATITATLGDGPGEFQRADGCPSDQTATVTGGSAADLLLGGPGPDDFTGGGGDDDFRSGGGNDILRGGPGNDELEGQDGNDQLFGEDGNDKLTGGGGDDASDAGAGDDLLGLGDDPGADDLRGGAGFDEVDLQNHAGGVTVSLDDAANDGTPGEGDNVHTDVEKLFGTAGNDTITGSAGPDSINGYFGDDVIRAGAGDDSVDGNSGNDQLFGEAGVDTLYGGSDNDRVEGGPGTDNLFGDGAQCSSFGCSAGSDQLFARDGEADAVNCGSGADTAQVDAVDTLGADGFQVCETVDRAAAPAPAPTPTPTPGTPAVTPAVLAPGAKVTAGKRRFTVVFTLRRAATVTLTVTKKGARKALGKVTIKAKKGKTTRAITKIGKRKLAKGTYKVVLKVGSSSKTFSVKVR